LISFSNARAAKQDDKAYDFQPELFETDGKFAAGAIGIVIIIVSLYAYFW